MRWPIISVIFRREVRDQSRDRRTLFMIFVLPILLYPILGIGIVQFTAAFEQKPRDVLVLGTEYLPATPPLLNEAKDGFVPGLFDPPGEASKLRVQVQRAEGKWLDPKLRTKAVQDRYVDALVMIPADLQKKLEVVRSAEIPILYESTDERSQITYLRVKEVLAKWEAEVLAARLERDKKPASYTQPIQLKAEDVASASKAGVSVWSRLFPFLLVMMALTGAFYPAIDLCAGEKERGTMETLLISPASRAEIVMGKFLTVMLASIMTALLNLLSMALTGFQLAMQLGSAGGNGQRAAAAMMAPPRVSAMLWMLVLLVPLAVFFSALCVALAVLAKSMKEGQYYMTPLYLTCLPLIFLTLAPGIELNLFYSLVPVTGIALLLRALILGDYGAAALYFVPVLVPTVLYGVVALRWAISQFQREDVLFREAERFDLRIWVRHLLRDKGPVPSGGEALFCFVLMLTSAWFLIQILGSGEMAGSLASMVIGQLAFILGPPLVMGVLLTSSPRRTLRLFWPSGRYLLIGIGLAFALNPLVNELQPIVGRLFPISEAVKEALQKMLSVPNLGLSLVIFAVIPAICEEIAFRGFILSGLEQDRDTRSAIVLSALLFGFLHVLLSLFQQLFNATLLGIVLGLIAVRSRSIVPGMVFHFINNGLAVLRQWAGDPSGWKPLASWLYRDPAEGLYHWWLVAVGAVSSVLLLVVLNRRGDAKLAVMTSNKLDTVDAIGPEL